MSQTQDVASSQRGSGAVNLTIVTDPLSPVAEAYRSLRSTVKFANVEPPVRTLLIADAGTGGRHSEAAANLAAALAIGGDRVILVDANLREPRLHTYFGLPNALGLADWLAVGGPPEAVATAQTGLEHLRLLCAGQVPAASVTAPADLLGGERAAALIAWLRAEADFVVIDAPPLSQVGDALALAGRVDATLLLIRSGKTKRSDAQRAREALDRVGARILGAVLIDRGGRRIFG